MLLENIAIGRTIEIFVDREGYCYRLTSKVEAVNSKRVCVTYIAANGRAFSFDPDDNVKIVYRDSEQMWEWDNVRAGAGKLNNEAVHFFDIRDGGKSFNRRNAYRVAIEQQVMVGYYDQFGTTAKSSMMQVIPPKEGIIIPTEMTIPKFEKGMVRDISETGVGVCTNFEFRIDDGLFFRLKSPYGNINIRAQVVRKTELRASKNKYINYYGCVITESESKLAKYIFEIQRQNIREKKGSEELGRERLEAIAAQKETSNEEPEENNSDIAEQIQNDIMQSSGIQSNSIQSNSMQNNVISNNSTNNRLSGNSVRNKENDSDQEEARRVKGIKTAADAAKYEKQNVKAEYQRIQGIRTVADEINREKENSGKKQPQKKIEGIKTAGLK